jgi:ABC-type amino acid transport substrate-binding protein
MKRFSSNLRGLGTVLLLLALAFAPCARAAEVLRLAVYETMSYPFNIRDAGGHLSGGLLMEMGEQMARELGTRVKVLPFSRMRIEPSVLAGEADLVCYSSPQWSDKPAALQWSIPTLPQIERAVVKAGKSVPDKVPEDFKGLRITLQLGYHYPSIQPLFDAGQARRVDQTKVQAMFRAVDEGVADVLVVSEAEIEGYFKDNPADRKRYAQSAKPFSVVQTQCGLSPKSPWKLEQINKALSAMMARGDMERLARRYGLAMH